VTRDRILGAFSISEMRISPSDIALPYYHSPSLTNAGIIHGFMTRQSDVLLRDEEVRRSFGQALSGTGFIVMDQVHGDEVHVVSAGERPGRGDGLIIGERGIVGVIKTADCLPVILYDLAVPLVAVIHAGWRGTAARITQKAIARMKRLGARIESMGALIGPGIGPCCYNVGNDVVVSFQNAGFSEGVFKERGGSLFLDLKQANREIVEQEGIVAIHDIGLCTSCRQDLFFSARRNGQAGRQVISPC
jgi:polyphenol oxidase